MKKELYYYMCTVVVEQGLKVSNPNYDIIKNIKYEGIMLPEGSVQTNIDNIYIKIVSDKILVSSHLSFYRELLDRSMGIKILSIALSMISHEDYLQMHVEIDNSKDYISEVDQCILQLQDYTKKINVVDLESVDHTEFEKSCDFVIKVLKLSDKSDELNLEYCDFRYFEFKEYIEGNEIIVSIQEIMNEEIK